MSISKYKSRELLCAAVRYGSIKRPRKCSQCGRRPKNKRFIHGHHHKGYDRWWDVRWLCLWCHRIADAEKHDLRGAKSWPTQNPEKTHFALNNPNRKLTEAQVRRIKKMLAGGVPAKKIAPQFSVTYENIWAIKTGKTWSRV